MGITLDAYQDLNGEAMTIEKRPTIHELWKQSGDDREKYRQLLHDRGYLVKRESMPENHPFQGLTRLCLCDVCGGSLDSPWHQGQASLVGPAPIICEGCGGEINPDYGECQRCG